MQINEGIAVPGLLKTALCLLLVSFSGITVANAGGHSVVQNKDTYAKALEAWQLVLSEHVDEMGRTDFVSLAKQPELLEQYVTAVAGYGPASNPQDFASREEVLAYHANTYNALAMHGVITEGIPEAFDSFFKRAGFFKFRAVQIDGNKTNLYDYENKVIRPLDEPRMHFVLNCMVRDCPRLPQQVFRSETMEQQLAAATSEFLNSEKHVQIDDEAKRIRVSAIMDFYTKDFVASGKRRDLPQYINRYRSEPLPDGFKVEYLTYDWTINQQPD